MRRLKGRYQQGQAVLVVLLIVVVALGYGLSIISQSVTDTEIAGQSEESARTFNAAEAGIEDALKNVSFIAGEGKKTIQVGEDENKIEVNYEVTGNTVLEGVYQENEIATVNLGGANTLKIEWVDSGKIQESPGTCNGVSGGAPASLLITVINNADEITRYGLNACPIANGMTTLGVNDGTDGYLKEYSLGVAAGDKLVKIRPIYNQAKIRVTGATALPPQAYDIDSQAQSLTLESKAIQVNRTVPATPSIFDYVLFSGTSIEK